MFPPESIVEYVREGVVGHDPGAAVIVHRHLDAIANLDAAARHIANVEHIASSNLRVDMVSPLHIRIASAVCYHFAVGLVAHLGISYCNAAAGSSYRSRVIGLAS